MQTDSEITPVNKELTCAHLELELFDLTLQKCGQMLIKAIYIMFLLHKMFQKGFKTFYWVNFYRSKFKRAK